MRSLVALLVFLPVIPITMGPFPIFTVSANGLEGSVACYTDTGLESGHFLCCAGYSAVGEFQYMYEKPKCGCDSGECVLLRVLFT